MTDQLGPTPRPHSCGVVERPCAHGECRWHLEGSESCTLDVCDWGGASIEEVADAMGIELGNVRQIQGRAIVKIRGPFMGRPTNLVQLRTGKK